VNETQNADVGHDAEAVRPKVAVDTVLFAMENHRLRCYLVQLRRPTASGRWAFPGGLVRVGETLDEAARRELKDGTGLEDVYLEQLFSFGDPSRDPHAHVVSVGYMGLINSIDLIKEAGKSIGDGGKAKPSLRLGAHDGRIAADQSRVGAEERRSIEDAIASLIGAGDVSALLKKYASGALIADVAKAIADIGKASGDAGKLVKGAGEAKSSLRFGAHNIRIGADRSRTGHDQRRSEEDGSRSVEDAIASLVEAGDVSAHSKKYASGAWYSVGRLPPLAYDHTKMADYALERLRSRLLYTDIASNLLPKVFTIAELRDIYQAVLDRGVDRRNFERRMRHMGLLKKLRKKRLGLGRPARLYSFRSRSDTVLKML
jgi:ADP-ribose pyrophosphatase YjhB (NUDIX family)